MNLKTLNNFIIMPANIVCLIRKIYIIGIKEDTVKQLK